MEYAQVIFGPNGRIVGRGIETGETLWEDSASNATDAQQQISEQFLLIVVLLKRTSSRPSGSLWGYA